MNANILKDILLKAKDIIQNGSRNRASNINSVLNGISEAVKWLDGAELTKGMYVRHTGRPFSAVCWNGNNLQEIFDLVGKMSVVLVDKDRKLIVLQSFGKKVVVEIGDYIFRDNGLAISSTVVMRGDDFTNTFKKIE